MFLFIKENRGLLFLVISIVFLLVVLVLSPLILSGHYYNYNSSNFIANSIIQEKKVEIFVPNYIDTPKPVRGIYMTSWIASSPNLREPLIGLIEKTELNSIVIDIKDYSGKVFFPTNNEQLVNYGTVEPRVVDMKDFIVELHEKGIYVIGRLAVFQDANLVKKRPDLAVKNKKGDQVWKDRKGISWIDPGSQEYWNYILNITLESRKIGFDEVNFDYIRFPSDGDMKDISFPFSSTTRKSIVIKNFFEYLYENLKDTDLKTSADLFGMVTTSEDDMGIGQILENALPYFDYISPMVYPSHYSSTFENINDPESHPYETVYKSMMRAVERANIASSSPHKFRPWLQDFSMREKYGTHEVKEQIRATYDSGLDSWLLWSPSNRYTSGALQPK